ncbi:hypothetical protein J1C81_10600 [Streptococcus sanguinis]|jgi:hypothetical protein|uniref:Uncharacterized protein n=1 Tax=Streptococcus sanguinis SK330 TaxID=888813 RepID=F2CB05_STRSA|nr:hypothetical protein [Streptococcus sanguinis]EGF12362.1 hypothetical protein HMPREF9386_2371 [Streptococcus sanguinis SK330]RKW03309.1 MAG: hypothetical protein D8H99_11340 [Streptococcus sp.]
MSQLEVLRAEHCQLIVDSVLKGNDDFSQKMKAEKDRYRINSAAKNGRVNIIDSSLFKAFEENKFSFIQDSNIKKAGRTWEYGEYICETTFGKFLFIVKSEDALKRGFSKSNVTETTEQEEKEYIEAYLEINKRVIRQSKEPLEGLFEQPISLFEDERESLISLIDDEGDIYKDIAYFFVLSYKVSNEKLTNIQLIFPNPITNNLRLAQDLTDYIQSSQFDSNDNSQYTNITYSPQESDDDISIFDERIAEVKEIK